MNETIINKRELKTSFCEEADKFVMSFEGWFDKEYFGDATDLGGTNHF